MTKAIIKKAAIEAMSGLAKKHFLNPDASRINKSLGDAAGITGFGFHIIEVPPGCESTEKHAHHFEDECAYVLSGQGEVVMDDEVHVISEGDYIAYPAGGPAHTMKNTGEAVLRCIIVGQRLAHDVVDYPDKKKRLYRNNGIPWDVVDSDAIEHPNAGRKA